MKKIITCLVLSTQLSHAHLPSHIPRLSSYPYISGDTFRLHADVIFEFANQQLTYDAIHRGAVIFVKRDLLDIFFTDHHSHIKYPYILTTHNADEDITEEYKSYLDDKKIIVWFGQNVNYTHPKLIPLPLGLANRYWHHGNINIINAMREKINQGAYKKNKLLYLNINIATNTDVRKKVFETLNKQPYCYSSNRKPFVNYLEDLATSYFVASPRGGGIDCHRTWEAMLMGSIPIIESSHLNYIFHDLPVLIIDDWSCVTKEYLEGQYEVMQYKTYNWNKLFTQYWLDLINSYKSMQE